MKTAMNILVVLATVFCSVAVTSAVMSLNGYTVNKTVYYWSVGCEVICMLVMGVLVLVNTKPTKYEREVDKTLTKL